jgi:acyl-CoA dehydrogenase
VLTWHGCTSAQASNVTHTLTCTHHRARFLPPQELRVVAVLDWELATLGDPLADVAYAALPYNLPVAHAGFPALPPGPVPAGVPDEASFRAAYFRAVPGGDGRDPFAPGAASAGLQPPASWAFYVALSLFRAAAILAGVRARAAAGNAAAPNARAVGALVGALATRAAQLAGLPPASPSASASHASQTVPPADAGLMPVPPRVAPLLAALHAFMVARVYPAEAALHAHARSAERWSVHPLVEELKAAARAAGLWNLWLPRDSAALLRVPVSSPDLLGPGLSNAEYAPLAEVMGRSPFAPELFNCSAPDTGNMEVLLRYGSAAQQARWLLPLLEGRIRSCFAMTEPGVASSDATNIGSTIAPQPDGRTLRLRGAKWWTSGACDPRCALAIFMGKSSPDAKPHLQQSMVLVPMDAPGVAVLRPLTVFGYDDAPHGHAEMTFSDVVVSREESLLLGEGRGFEIAQGRLGPGRLHHCMRLIGAAGRGLELARARGAARVAFGKPLAAHGAFAADLAKQRLALEQARLLTLAAAAALDAGGNKTAAGAIAMAKLAAPAAAGACLDFAIQAHGAAGVCDDTPLAYLWAAARTLRIADGPDEVHLTTLAKLEMKGKARL